VLFNSYIFVLAFLPLTLAGFWLAARLGRTVAGCWLVAASLLFYGWWRPGDVPLLVVSVAANYAASRLIAATAGRRMQDWLLAAGIAANILLLIRFKYLPTLLGLAGVPMAAPALPLGISFFTFTQIGFLIDCRQGPARERGWLSYALFVTFFPHLIAGPILHNREIMPQFTAATTYRASADNVAAGLAMFLIGLLKKCLLADPLAVTVAAGFAHPHGLALFGAWQAATSYSLQLYFDFSGYSDMAIGIARMFNLRFPANFNSPYKSQSVIEYWQRWHMTLTRCLMMYLYNPIALRVTRRRVARGLAVNRQGQATVGGFAAMVLLPTWVTLALAGVWHGSGATFLVFGLLHAAYLSVNHAWRLFRPRPRGQCAAAIIGRIALTYGCVLVGSVVFRAPSLWSAGQVLGAMLGLHGVSVGFADGVEAMRAAAQTGWIAVLYTIVWAAPNTQQIMHACGPTLEAVRPGPLPWLTWRISLPWAAALGCAAAIGLSALGGTGEFLYFQF
jgi:D-alanyl-lipoteichoic acid acyltransferase DltB (MBOAT superfamily)